MRTLVVCTTVMLAITFSLHAAPPKGEDLVKAQLLADVEQIQPGQPFTVGVLLRIEPKWHVYWKNPGDAGAPTRVQFKLPSGFSVSELSFPLPISFEQPGDISGYGYEDEVMLLATVTPPKKLEQGQTLRLHANASWLVCHDVCIMGAKDLSLELPVGQSASPANQELFATWKQRLPQPNPGMTVEPYSGQRNDAVVVSIELDQPARDVEWFIGSSDHFMADDLQVTTEGKRSTFRFVPSPPVRGSVTLPMLVTYTDSEGTRRGVEQEIQIGQVRTGSAHQP
jgi:DsbC/DsbD-like thiol-disulfide interchange protein